MWMLFLGRLDRPGHRRPGIHAIFLEDLLIQGQHFGIAEGSGIDGNSADIALEEVAGAAPDKNGSQGEVRAVTAKSVREEIGILAKQIDDNDV